MIVSCIVCENGALIHCRFAFVEFASPDSVPIALQYNGAMFGDRPVK